MMYEQKLKETMLDVLENRMSGIADCIQMLLNQGYIPNKNKITIFNFCNILIHAYENVDVLSKEQHKKLDELFNKIISL